MPGSAPLVEGTSVQVVRLQTLVLRPQSYDYTRAEGTLAAVVASTATPPVLQQISCNASDFEQVRTVGQSAPNAVIT